MTVSVNSGVGAGTGVGVMSAEHPDQQQHDRPAGQEPSGRGGKTTPGPGTGTAGWAWWWQARAGHGQAVSGRVGSVDARQQARTRQRLERLADTRHVREHTRQRQDRRSLERREDRGGGGRDER